MNIKEVLFNRNFFLFRSDNSIYEKSCNKNVYIQALMSEHEKRGNNFLSSILILCNAVVVYHAIW